VRRKRWAPKAAASQIKQTNNAKRKTHNCQRSKPLRRESAHLGQKLSEPGVLHRAALCAQLLNGVGCEFGVLDASVHNRVVKLHTILASNVLQKQQLRW